MTTKFDVKDIEANQEEFGYSYEPVSRHLTGKQALKRYGQAKNRYPEAIVELSDLDCGHWTVSVYKTPTEKQDYLERRMRAIFERVLSRLKMPIIKR